MTPKHWNEYNLQNFEKEWFEQLKTIDSDELHQLIEYSSVLNKPKRIKLNLKQKRLQKKFKRDTIQKFIVVLMGYDTERQNIAKELIDKYWRELHRPELLQQLLKHAPFKIFKTYFNKARIKPDQSKWLLVQILKHDNYKEAKWILEQNKVNKWLTADNLGFIDAMMYRRLKDIDTNIKEEFAKKKQVAKIAIKEDFSNLLPKEIKNIFIF